MRLLCFRKLQIGLGIFVLLCFALLEFTAYFTVTRSVLAPSEIGNVPFAFLFYRSDDRVTYAATSRQAASMRSTQDLLSPGDVRNRRSDFNEVISSNLPAADSRDSCVSVYGGTGVYVPGIDKEKAWPNVLSRSMQCPVSNFGILGHGPDQAFLNFQQNASDNAPVTILGVVDENIIRIINRDGRLLRGYPYPKFKPRFVLNDRQELQLIPALDIRLSEIESYVRDPGLYLADEWFLPDSQDGPVVWAFPYSTAMVRTLFLPRVRNRMRGWPSWSHFYDDTHPSGAKPLLREIIRSLGNLRKVRGENFYWSYFQRGQATGTRLITIFTLWSSSLHN